MHIFHTIAEFRAWRRAQPGLALVPTMGALHAGHLSLIEQAGQHGVPVAASIFVNPTQFAPHEDFDAYPRTVDADCAALDNAGCDAVFAPTASEIYQPHAATTFTLGGAARGLEADIRPHHFGGVALVVNKLFNITNPTYALFGEKDFQQLAVITQMVRDLNMPVHIIGCPTQRADDGLALSSRNVYLNAGERAAAPILYQTLKDCAARIQAANETLAIILQSGIDTIIAAGFDRVDYLALHDATTLAPLAVHPAPGTARLLVAAHIGTTRLIDNVAV